MPDITVSKYWNQSSCAVGVASPIYKDIIRISHFLLKKLIFQTYICNIQMYDYVYLIETNKSWERLCYGQERVIFSANFSRKGPRVRSNALVSIFITLFSLDRASPRWIFLRVIFSGNYITYVQPDLAPHQLISGIQCVKVKSYTCILQLPVIQTNIWHEFYIFDDYQHSDFCKNKLFSQQGQSYMKRQYEGCVRLSPCIKHLTGNARWRSRRPR